MKATTANRLLLPALLLSSSGAPLFAQDTLPGERGDAVMEYYLEQHEFVAAGHFSSWPQEAADDVLQAKEITLEFVPERVFKTPLETSEGPITVHLVSDMLIYPDEDISRYAKQEAILEEVSARLDAARTRTQELYELRQAGEISEEEYREQAGELYPRYYALIQETAEAMAARNRVGVIDGVTFYELGGALQPGESYLLFTNRSEQGQYTLDPIGSSSYIYWGERKELYEAVLDRIAE